MPDTLGILKGYYSNPKSIDVNVNGVYNTDPNVPGTWPESVFKYGVLIVCCSKSFGGVQLYFPNGGTSVYFRTSYNIGVTWALWKQI